MLPQSSILVLAPIVPGREDELRGLLDRLNRAPGFADPANPLIPFGQFDRVHLARFVILEDPTPDDIAVYGLAPTPLPPTLAFFADCDGSRDAFLTELEFALQRPHTRELQPFDVLTPHAREIRRLAVPHGDGEVGSEEQVQLAELDLLQLVDVARGLEDDEQRVAVPLELRPLVGLDGVLDGQLMQVELMGHRGELLLAWFIQIKPRDSVSRP